MHRMALHPSLASIQMPHDDLLAPTGRELVFVSVTALDVPNEAKWADMVG